MWQRFLGAAALAALAAGHFPRLAGAETQLSIYAGSNFAYPSDVSITRPGGTDVMLKDVGWDSKPFHPPPYFGLRFTNWLNSAPNLGFGVDYTHAKVYARLGDRVAASGTLAGVDVQGSVLLDSAFKRLEFTDGLNVITAHAFYRCPLGERWTPYLGAGLGAAIPHVEVFMPGYRNTFGYQATGVAARGYAGLEVKLYENISGFAEYQFSYERIDKGRLTGGGTISTDIANHHLNVGLSYAFAPF